MKQSGMTLIEVMVAVAITAIMSVMIWSGFSQTARNRKRIDARSEHYQGIRLTLERMAREFSMAFVSAQNNPSPGLQVMQTMFVGVDRSDRDRVDFTSFSHRRLFADSHESDQNELSYFVAPDPEESGSFVLVRRVQRRIDDKPREGGQVQIMLRGVTGFELEYFDPLTGEWQREWDTTNGARHPNRLPAQVKIKLSLHSPGGQKEETYVTRATIPLLHAINHSTYSP